ncbi:beta-1,3-galactosyltransferase 2 isoform X2 [Denticeps clupeoides]|uniref:beta-1,3-galactosyltransferase 2 isoform X2 n=1 Tax=Denticeps clupeoides TaxID=299321 RepID=UPI0010A4D291|nr:beta-1,3-galactosyltransferase 2-like isoform X2 [Denticeps clupeoides]
MLGDSRNTGSCSATTNISKPDTDIIMDAGAPEPYYVAYPKKYNFTLNEPLKCQEEKPFVAVVVPVAPQDQTHRDAIRSTWGSERLILNKVVSFFFLLGLPSGDGSAHVQEDILQESREHQDILQANFLDSYYNLTIKTMVMLEWLSMHCTDISYAMKIDSDMFLNVHNLIQLLLQAPKINYMTGLVAKGGIVLRDPSSKWYIPQEVFPEPFYPPYALGLGYVLSIDLSLKLVEAAKNVKALYIEDVYLGLCMKQLGIPPTDPPNQSLFNVFPVDYSRCQYSKLIATTTNSLNDQVNFWTDLQKPGPPC